MPNIADIEPHQFRIQPSSANPLTVEIYEDFIDPEKTFVLTQLRIINTDTNIRNCVIAFDEDVIPVLITNQETYTNYLLGPKQVFQHLQASSTYVIDYRDKSEVPIRKSIQLDVDHTGTYFVFIGYLRDAYAMEIQARILEEIQEQYEDFVQVDVQQQDMRGYAKVDEGGLTRQGQPYYQVKIARDPESEE